jgi:predicted phage tail protein
MKRVILYGDAGRQFGKYWNLDVHTPGEAIRAIIANKPKFHDYLLQSSKNGQAFKVYCGREAIVAEEEYRRPFSTRDVIRIVPVMMGASTSSGKAIVQIIIGAILIYFSGPIGGAYSGLVSSVGTGLILHGVTSLLTPRTHGPNGPGDGNEDKPSFFFNGPVNTVLQGNCVPICYGGPIIVGSQVISAGIFAIDI